MSKPIREIGIRTAEEISGTVQAVFDSGSFYSIIREDKLPAGAAFIRRKVPKTFSLAAKTGSLRATGEVSLVMRIGEREIDDVVLVSNELKQEMLVGAGTMQKWDISIRNRKGQTEISVARDMHDPVLTEID